MNKILAIVGSGELGLQIAKYAIEDNHYQNVVFFDDFNNNESVKGYKILGKIEEIENAFFQGKFSELLIGIGYNHMKFRSKIFNHYLGKIPFGKIIHSSCYVDKSSEIKEGSILYPFTIIDKNVSICENVLINLNSVIAHDSIINSHTIISPKVAIAGFVTIEKSCFLGINSTFIDHISIASETQIAAGSVVTKSIYKKGLYVGNPIRFIR